MQLFRESFAKLLAAKHCYRHLLHEHCVPFSEVVGNYSMNGCHRWYIPVGWYYTALLTTDNHPIIGWGGEGGEAGVFCWKSRPRSPGDGPHGYCPSTRMHNIQSSLPYTVLPDQTEPVFVNHLRSAGIDSQPGRPVQQLYLKYRLARLHRLVESIPWNRLLDKSMHLKVLDEGFNNICIGKVSLPS